MFMIDFGNRDSLLDSFCFIHLIKEFSIKCLLRRSFIIRFSYISILVTDLLSFHLLFFFFFFCFSAPLNSLSLNESYSSSIFSAD